MRLLDLDVKTITVFGEDMYAEKSSRTAKNWVLIFHNHLMSPMVLLQPIFLLSIQMENVNSAFLT